MLFTLRLNPIVPLAAAALALAFHTASVFAQAPTLSLIYTGPLQGELEPCGCSPGTDLGGLRRLASEIDRLRTEDPALLLLSTGGLLGTSQPAHQITNRFILEGISRLRYDALALRWADLVYGPSRLKETNAPWVASNWQSKRQHPEIRTSLRIERDSRQIAFFQWLSGERSPHQGQPETQQRVHDTIGQLTKQLRMQKDSGALTILALEGDRKILAPIPAASIDILLLASQDEQFAAPEYDGPMLVLKAGTRGQRLGYLKLTRDAASNWLVQSHQIIALDETIPNASRLDGWYARYEQALIEDYRAREQRARENHTTAIYAGDADCATCHSKQRAHWAHTDHAQAFQSLLDVSKQFDANCIGCHVVGFGRPGGFYSAQATPDLRNVACEACHGPANEHQRLGGTIPMPKLDITTCQTCHTAEHSPEFDPESYWLRITH